MKENVLDCIQIIIFTSRNWSSASESMLTGVLYICMYEITIKSSVTIGIVSLPVVT